MIIQRAYLPDISELAILFDQYRQFYLQPSDHNLAKAFLTERIAANESVIFVAKEDDNKICGFVQLYPSFSSISAKRSWILNDLFVLESCRGKGVGKALLDKAKAMAIETAATSLTLETHHTNTEAQKLYLSLGYKLEDQFKSYYLKLTDH
ncbi:GNAT family N-acetyltransferase [Pseudoalteromonas tunicata]|jgi:ribosomal protein S18 acetylase RimI-like enzyme|uniref:Acetyltransferase n=1 Tax=Pseudoalteromonas tunicata D2 TaxID=87626 RepID=A4CE69_9GAMM|nr:GNAT family N-acetyltransferase [Pseudoalteromonas tunicata]ATC93083.1 hypothetical protein PTUN_a0265 [Pseudoalteromonas tunicata]AXT32158.1 GNAT family N-acetyltransferase [Pseudoalteromonas tunicata]EAR26881.1 Acetyltransferase [Pseudoalteromonas tunicata D2]MDP4984664.1 GNAT family N-acetyltransferase [Pseudoalteromonas tunicata]MDP5213602.1 GNAT family N-acetyltransferase [Pseudoalteromonas tunicata]